ncbi:hypothetical protein MNBD_ALPHA05-918 [hydrothermal vent metagenome]|uniref:PEGA domain-containing protein n=1 Tax=hydrothermal vent metagenome TaxID=652676 RepID=A0A3B0SPC4_9ZZZZ
MYHSSRFRILLLSPFLLSACVQGQGVVASEVLRIKTSPAGATAVSSYGDECVTPCHLFLPTDKGGEVTISKAGYETQTIAIGTKFDTVGTALRTPDYVDPSDVVFDAVLLAAFGKGMYKNLEPNRINIVLMPIDLPENAQEAS